MNKLREEFCKETNTPMGLDNVYDYVFWLEAKIEALSQHDVMLTFADLEDGILKHKAKSEYKQASIIIVRDVFKANAT